MPVITKEEIDEYMRQQNLTFTWGIPDLPPLGTAESEGKSRTNKGREYCLRCGCRTEKIMMLQFESEYCRKCDI